MNMTLAQSYSLFLPSFLVKKLLKNMLKLTMSNIFIKTKLDFLLLLLYGTCKSKFLYLEVKFRNIIWLGKVSA